MDWLDREKQRFGNRDLARIVLVDWLDMIRSDNPGKGAGNRDWDTLVDVTEQLAMMARRYDVGIWTATQATKEAEGVARGGMRHTAFAYHKNDFVHISILLTAPNLDRQRSETSTKLSTCERTLNFSITKNRNNRLKLIQTWQGPTLRIYGDMAEAKRMDQKILEKDWNSLFAINTQPKPIKLLDTDNG